MHSSSSRQQHTTRLRLGVRHRAGHSLRGVPHHGIVHNITTMSSTSCITHATHSTYVQRRTRRRDDRWLYLCVCCCVFNSLSRSSRLASNYSVWQTPGHKTTSGASQAPVASEAARFFCFFSCTGSSSTMTASESLPRVGRGEPGSDSTPTVSSSLSTTVGDAGEDAGKDSADASSAAQRCNGHHCNSSRPKIPEPLPQTGFEPASPLSESIEHYHSVRKRTS